VLKTKPWKRKNSCYRSLGRKSKDFSGYLATRRFAQAESEPASGLSGEEKPLCLSGVEGSAPRFYGSSHAETMKKTVRQREKEKREKRS